MSKTFTIDEVLEKAHNRAYGKLPKGDTFKDLSTVIITPVRGDTVERAEKECPHCGEFVEYEKTVSQGFHPIVVESWKRMIRPMNQPIVELLASNHEV